MPINAQVSVRLDRPGAGEITVRYATRSGTVLSGVAFRPASGALSFEAGTIVKQIPITILDGATPGTFFIDLTMPDGAVITKSLSTIRLVNGIDQGLLATVISMLDAQWGYIRRATGVAASAAGMPPLVTAEGLVKNSQHPETLLGGYLPQDAAVSEGIALLMRGVARSYDATRRAEDRAYFDFLFEAMIQFYFFGVRPPGPGVEWPHTWLVHAGQQPFAVRGPVIPDKPGEAGYVLSPLTFTNGVATITEGQPQVIYQLLTDGTELDWPNVFAAIKPGTGSEVPVDWYVAAGGNKVYGTQKNGSFGQPIQPGAPEPIGTVKLKGSYANFSGTLRVNYSVTVPGVTVAYGEAYEGWPMWRKLMPNEYSIAADAIHWFVDAFQTMSKIHPENTDYQRALARMLDTWTQTCTFDSDGLLIFKGGSRGQYNSYPLSTAYAYGRENIDNPATAWSAVPPTTRFRAERTSDGYVTFTLPNQAAEVGSGQPIRYGFAFENSTLYLTYTALAGIAANISTSRKVLASFTSYDTAGEAFTANVTLAAGASAPTIPMANFRRFDDTGQDSDGLSSGDWEDNWVPPIYPAVPFPGRRGGTVGDSITFYIAAYVPPKPGQDRFENYGSGFAGSWSNAEQILRGRSMLEHGIQPNLTGNNRGTSFAVAGTKVANWWRQTDYPAGPEAPQMGPMYAALNNLSRYDWLLMMGGTNDLSGNASAASVLLNLKKAATDVAKNGKWVFLCTITPRTRAELKGYTLAQQDTIRARILAVNQGIRDWITNDAPANIFLVDWYNDLLGPNGIDPFGLQSDDSNPAGLDTPGNYRADRPGEIAMHDGLHPAPPGGQVMGEKLAAVFLAAGFPPRVSQTTLGPLTLGANILPNPNMTFTQFDTTPNNANYNMSDIGWAFGLGPQQKVGNLHDGFLYGKMPNNWHFYRSTNAENIQIGIGTGGVYSNFMAYTYEDMKTEFPKVLEYMGDSTWPDGSVVVSITTADGMPALQIDVDMPVTGNKNESFVICQHFPRRQHGPWDNYGYSGPDQSMIVPNSLYAPGDKILSETDFTLQGLNGTMHSMQAVVYFYQSNPGVSFGARRLSFGNHPFFYPPSDMDRIRFARKDRTLLVRSPAIIVPQPLPLETMQYGEVRYEIGFDASQVGPKARIIIKNCNLRKVTGGSL